MEGNIKLWCQDHIWRANFGENSFKAYSITLPQAFHDFMNSDSIVIDENDSEDPAQLLLGSEGMRKLISDINIGIEYVGGKGVVPKLNWSAPQDALWMHELKCCTYRDVLLLIKSSELISNDMSEAEQLGIPLVMNLVRYHNLADGMTFRCFVKNSEIVGISQKTSINTPFLAELKIILTEKITDFYNDVVDPVINFEDFCFDVYVDIPPRYKCWLLGFSSWDEDTSSLLFSWEELNQLSSLEFRTYDSESIQPNDYSANRVPIEMTDGTDLEEFFKNLRS
ncbi:CDC123 [Blepharisma stoltei]|uniref:Cell division cycle protein 123 n=1 Tax=Blepharisma stoltei TaxID=1481888 RepID=A0AAU9JKJ7_9CILI|nr:unnamed protein product [Blepharisma stoltei]